ncbi:MAG: orotidine-5'-phosphate decarboxylase [Oscillospiraceae bacterium]|nr:orotidine-5'-phosphate decarboxylase [Oscillospiraceae bacterium]
MAKDVIIACDFPSGEETLAFLDKFQGRARPYVKIGMELFYAQGPDIVKRLKDRGHPVFLDLKLHDIPNTVGRAMRVLSHLGADMVNLHAAGGSAMMEAAIEGLSSGSGQRPLLIAVTQLTSTSQERLEQELLIPRPMEEVVTAYARTAKAAGLDGVVCSPLEAGTIHAACGNGFLTVTPGVRFAGAAGDDQQRVTTPAGARSLGSDYIVVGRPITQAPDAVACYEKCLRDLLTDNTNE